MDGLSGASSLSSPRLIPRGSLQITNDQIEQALLNDPQIRAEASKISTPVYIVIAFLIIIIVILILLWAFKVIGYQKKPIQIDTAALTNAGLEKSGWGPSIPSNDPIRSQCSVYTFPPQSGNQPAQPTYNQAVIDTLQPQPIDQVKCVNPNQLALQQITRTCEGDGFVPGKCYDDQGRVYTTGQVQTEYQLCSNQACPGELTLPAVNFTNNNFGQALCFTSIQNNPGVPIIGRECSLQNQQQYFNVVRQSVSGTAPNVALSQDDGGSMAAIIDANTQLCLAPINPNPLAGTQLSLQSCSSLANNGVVWQLIPPFVPDNTTTLAAQQILYTTNPTTITATQITEYIKNNSPLAISTNGISGQQLILAPASLQSITTTQAQRNQVQLLKYTIYNQLTNTLVPFYAWS